MRMTEFEVLYACLK